MTSLNDIDFDTPFTINADGTLTTVDAPGHPGDTECLVIDANGEFVDGNPAEWHMVDGLIDTDPINHPSAVPGEGTANYLLEKHGHGPYVMTAIEAECVDCEEFRTIASESCETCMGDPEPAGWAIWVSNDSETIN